MKIKKPKLKLNIGKTGDFALIVTVILLSLFGIAMVFSASYYKALNDFDNASYFAIRQCFWVAAGYVLMYIFSKANYHVWKKFSKVIYIVVVILLALIFTPLGVSQNGATRWLLVPGTGFTIMPGEFAKFALIVCGATFLSVKKDRIRDLKDGLIPYFLLAIVLVALIWEQPNKSTALIVLATAVGIAFVAGLKKIYLILAAGGVALGLVIIALKGGYAASRIAAWLHPENDIQGEGWQVAQGLYALGSGGLFGRGIGNSVQKTLYMPEPQNDFILTIIGEEIGLIGLMVLLLVFLFLIYRGFMIAANAEDQLGTLLASGITGLIAIQLVLNVCVVTALIPNTGVMLPFISYGGNGTMVLLALMGILVNISKHQKENRLQE
ncbi:MAG: putative lipid II flippase FtsW [Clostridia bacterium]|nr:putative lipid II flippase FtsW [Clostridia bacterium]